jgi:hypothetical protein
MLVPSDLSHFIEGGDAALDQIAKALDYLTNSAADKLGRAARPSSSIQRR